MVFADIYPQWRTAYSPLGKVEDQGESPLRQYRVF